MTVVKMPNDDLVNFPDNMPKEQIKALILKKFPDAGNAVPRMGQPIKVPPPLERGFMSRVGADIGKRAQTGKEIEESYKTGKQGLVRSALQHVGNVGFGTMADIGAEAISSAISTLPEYVKKYAGQRMQDLANTEIGKSGLAAFQQGAEKWDVWSKDNPEYARDVTALGNALAGVTAAKPAAMAVKAPIKIPGFLAGEIKTLAGAPKMAIETVKRALEPPDVKKMREYVKQDKNQLYADVDAAGGVSDLANAEFKQSLSELKPKDVHSASVWESSNAAKEVKRISDSMEQAPMTYSGLLANRSHVNGLIRETKNPNEERLLFNLKEKLDDALTSDDVSGLKDPEAGNKFLAANYKHWQDSSLSDLELYAEKAASKAQPANSLDTYINGLLTSRKARFLTKLERAALEDVVKNNMGSEFKRQLAGRLSGYVATAVGAQMGGPLGAAIGAAVGTVGSKVARDAAFNSKVKKLEKVYELIRNRELPKTIQPSKGSQSFKQGEFGRTIGKNKNMPISKFQNIPPEAADRLFLNKGKKK